MNNTSSPLVSVIIPVYNGTNYLREAIDSVLAQTFTNYEVIVIDDGSTDGTWDLVQSYGPCIRGFRQPNGGVASALNRGLKEMCGQWFAWLSHDDLWLPRKLERQVDFLLNSPQFKACYTDYFVIDSHGLILSQVETPWYPRLEAIRVLFGQMYIGGSTMLIERVCFDQIGFFSETLPTTQDVDMWIRFLQRFEIGRVPEKLVKERTHPSQDSRKVAVHHKEKIETYSRIFEGLDLMEFFPEWDSCTDVDERKANAYIWFGDTMALHRKYYALAETQYLRSIKTYPSWRNPARLKFLVNRAKSLFCPSYYQLRQFARKVLSRAMIKKQS